MAKSKKTEENSSKPIKFDVTQHALRQKFRTLVLGNPNYFGNLDKSPFKAITKIISNKTYEEIGCVGYHPDFERLHAVIYVNQTSGYGGDICTNGTQEYVRFYLSFDNGATWKDYGLSSFTTYDVAENKKRLEYAVTRKINPPRKFCFFNNQVLVRAILSWNVIPPADQPEFKPVWGDIHNTHIQIDPFKLIIVSDLLDAVNVDLPKKLTQAIDLHQPIHAKPKVLSLQERAALYANTKVEPKRFAFSELHSMLDKPSLSKHLMSESFTELLPGIDINFADIFDTFAETDGSTFYEELECVGYDNRTSTLVGILRVKQGNGYSGGPCTKGSREYVTFWGDFNNNGTFETCLGTAFVDVHDFSDVPREGLEYSVFLKVDLEKYQQPCHRGARLVPIRAIMSWQVAPPCANPNYVPVWGNREETVIHLAASDIDQDNMPILSSVGDIAVSDINASGYGNGIGIETGFVAEQSPFGGKINLSGKIVGGTAASKYRVMIKTHGAPDGDYVPLTIEPEGLKLTLVTFFGGVLTINPNHIVHADANGYYAYEDYAANHFVDGNILMTWFTGAAEDGKSYDLRVDLSVDGNPLHDIHGNAVTVTVDNSAPQVHLDINLGAGVDCADFDVNTVFDGHFSATDINGHFWKHWFVIRPSGPAGGVLPVSVPAAFPANEAVSAGGTIADTGVVGGTYTLDTTGMEPCGYSLTMYAANRTNVNSGVTRHISQDDVGFCIRE